MTPPRKTMAPLFRNFAARYRKRRRHRWKPSTLETFDIYLRNRLMPHFGRLRLDAIDHARVSAWFDAASVDKPGAANRAFEILRAMLVSARQWGELADHVPNACANIVKNPRRPVARYLDHAELKRLGRVLDRHGQEHHWRAAAIRLLTLTGARLSEILNLKWHEIGELSENGGLVTTMSACFRSSMHSVLRKSPSPLNSRIPISPMSGTLSPFALPLYSSHIARSES